MKYAPPIGSADPNAGYVDRTGSMPGSPVPAAAIEPTMREIEHCIKQAGLTPDANNLTQLWQAMSSMFRPNVADKMNRVVITTSTTWKAPFTGFVRVKLIGGGGGGARGASGGLNGGAGGFQGGSTAFGSLVATGGSGGGGGGSMNSASSNGYGLGGGGGGGAGEVVEGIIAVTKNQGISAVVGVGGSGASGGSGSHIGGGGNGPLGGGGGVTFQGGNGGGRNGGNGGPGLFTNNNFTCGGGGNGGSNGTGYGGGGGGGNAYSYYMERSAPGKGVDGGINGSDINGAAGGSGAIIIEYLTLE